MKTWLEKQMEKKGFYAHYVSLNKYSVNIHTHGLEESYSHPDLQICLPIEPKLASSIFNGIVQQIKEGERFDEEGYYDNVIQNFPVYIQKAKELDRDVMRIILPDSEGQFYDNPEEGNMYSYQKTTDTTA